MKDHSLTALGRGSALGSPYLQGMVIGAAVTYLLTNETVQKALIRGVARVIGSVQGGVEEMRERYRDAEAEMAAEMEEEGPAA